MNLIVASELTCNEGLYFRHITMVAKTELDYDVLIESEKDDIDYYFHLLKKHGWFDFVDDFVEPRHRSEGIRIDTELNYPMTIRTNQIVCENTLGILGQIKSMRNINELL
ncbi:hypothetical protein CL634_10275 [bacterium]|nr:hypothetical protein [bacterium]